MGTRRCMKNKINSTLHDKNNLIEPSAGGNRAMGQVLKLGLDVDLRNIAVAIQCERGYDRPGPEVFPRATDWLGEAKDRVRPLGARGLGVLRVWLHVTRATHWGWSTLLYHHADAFKPGATKKERSDGCAGVVCAAVALSGRAPGRVK